MLLKDVHTLMDTGVAYFPKFDHAIGDPEYSAIKINKSDYDIIIIEGIYLNCPHLSEDFNKVNNLFDYRIYVDSPITECVLRVKERNKCIPG